ncbi:hypothetical protein B7C42_06111 [Nocardia cerradoensis]|uniref:Uncharacterized protein n=1 Tax=Nocardia cerradoensis TaxID=85688 RepID=A0A231GYU2_9NOCA|nr:hypothetical protein B7C42_06111 [Nocardia cerradoensis]
MTGRAVRGRPVRGSGQATAVLVDEELDDEAELLDELDELLEPAESLDLDSLDFAAGSLADDEPLRLSVR